MEHCEECGEELYTCCGSGNLRCPTCDPPCPDCYDGGMDAQEDEEEEE